MQGTNLTAAHGHTALFGVYGMLGIGLMLYCLRGLKPDAVWKEGLLRGGFWSMNIGLGLMAVLTLLPMGVLQLEANLERGYWYARSAEFMNRPIIDLLVWLRVPGDTIRSDTHTSALQYLMRSSYAVFCLNKKQTPHDTSPPITYHYTAHFPT